MSSVSYLIHEKLSTKIFHFYIPVHNFLLELFLVYHQKQKLKKSDVVLPSLLSALLLNFESSLLY